LAGQCENKWRHTWRDQENNMITLYRLSGYVSLPSIICFVLTEGRRSFQLLTYGDPRKPRNDYSWR
jgi:hypothetical protein